MPNPHPDRDLIALREKIEQWIIDQGEYWDTDETLAANNITLWARAFMTVTDEEAEQAADRLRKQGAEDFVERVRVKAQEIMEIQPGLEPKEATVNAYALEVMDLKGI